MTEMQRIGWMGCYDNGWQSAPLTPEAYSHPAKISFGLAERIYRHMLAEGWLKPGDRVLDPFGGIGGCAFHAALYGLHFTGIELEPKFHELADMEYACPGFSKDFWRRYHKRPDYIAKLRAEYKLCPSCQTAFTPKTTLHKRTKFVIKREIPEQEAHIYRGNIPLWRERYAPVIPGYGSARVLQGDSRRLAEIVAAADACVSSPPFQGTLDNILPRSVDGMDNSAVATFKRTGQWPERRPAGIGDYGSTPGQLGALPAGSFAAALADGVVSSPPYAASLQGDKSSDREAGMRRYEATSHDDHWGATVAGGRSAEGYGETPGQLGAMPPGEFSACVSSPPYSETRIDGNGDEGASGLRDAAGNFVRGPAGWEQRKALGQRYGATPGNLGNLPAGNGFDATVSSPPYAESVNQGTGANDAAARIERKRAAGIDVDNPVNVGGPNSSLRQAQAYGSTPGQLGAMPTGNGFDATVSSPPYETGGHHDGVFDTWGGEISQGNGGCADWAKPGGGYGDSPAQLTGHGNTFWSAAREIVDQTYAVLKPGAVAAWITGDFVRSKQRVPFGQQWLALCESVGFEPLAWAVAWKTDDHGAQLGLLGEDKPLRKDRVSFFRRLSNEKNPESAILNEDVLFVRKPL